MHDGRTFKVIKEPENKGYEATSYLRYIIEHYESLDENTIFVHGDDKSWHHNGSIVDMINTMSFRFKYKNIGNQPPNNFLINGEIAVGQPHIKDLLTRTLKRWQDWNDIFYPLMVVPSPTTFITHICAQFYVHKSLILQHPKKAYETMYNMFYSSDKDQKDLACNFDLNGHGVSYLPASTMKMNGTHLNNQSKQHKNIFYK